MSVSFYLKRSATPSKRPLASGIALGELALNYDSATGGLYYKDSADNIVKVGPAQVSSAAPNSSPAGSSGNSVGEFWYDTANSALNIWSGSAWVATNTNSAYVANSAYTAKGVLLVGSAPNTPIALAVGTDGYVLVADSTEATGLKWVTAPSGGVTSITAGTGLTGGTITTTGTIALDTSGVTANSYTFANVTVDTYGRVTAASNGGDATTSAKGIVQVGTNIDVASGVISVADGSSVVKGVLQVGTNLDVASGVVSVADSSTSTKGVVQLNNTTTSTSTSLALTAAQGKSLQDQIDALAVTSNIILGGTFNANTGFVSSVTTEGTAAGLAVGSVLPAASSGNADYFVIVDVQGTNGPNSPTLVHVGDWFLSDGTTWQFLNVGFAPGQATTSSQGVVQLATDAEVQAGTDSSNAVVSSSLQSKLSDSTSTTSSSTIASSTAVKSAYDLAAAALPKSTFTALGDLVVGTGPSTFTALTVGANGLVLSANSACASGLSWISAGGSGSPATPTVEGIVFGLTDATNAALGCNALLGNTTGSFNTAIGLNALRCNVIATCNTAVGTCALSFNTGNSNTAVGSTALRANTTGTCNTAVGTRALCSNTTGGSNTAVGFCALHNNTCGGNNIAVGNCALLFNVSGTFNTAVGMCALCCNTTGVSNVGIGFNALSNNIGGCNNTAVGTSALAANTGCCNVAVGRLALTANTSGCCNVVLGERAGCTITTGCQNVVIGTSVQVASATGNCQLAIGFSATDNWLTGDSTKAIRPGAGIVDCAGFCGANGNVLMSNGLNAVCWGNAAVTPGQATTSSQGVVQLATDAEVQAGTDSSNAVVSSSLQSKLSNSTSTTSSSTIASSTAVKSAYDLAAAALPKDVFTAKGDIISGTGSATYVALPVGTNGQVLSADSTAASGLSWISVSGSGTVTSITAGTGLTGGTITTSGTIALANTEVTPGSYTNSSITVDAQGRLTAASSGTALVTSVTATGPITSSGGTTPVISTSMATNKLLGRSTAGTGVAEEITPGTNLTLSAGTLSAPAFATAAQMQGVATTATATSGATTITVASGTGIADGDSVYGVGIVPGTAVASGGGTTSIVLDTAIVNTLSATPATFNTNQTIVTPGDTGGGLLRAWVTYNPQQTGTWPGGASTVFRAAGSNTATITGANNHGLNVGSRVYALTGVAQVTNGYVVVSVLDAKRFTITTTASTLLNNVAITFYVSLIYNSYNIHTIFHANGLNSTNGIMYNFITPAPNIYYGFVGTSSGSAVIFTQGSIVNTTSTFNVQPWQLTNLSNMPNGVASIMVFG